MVHFSVFFVYMEQAEHEMLRHLGLSVMLADEGGPISFPASPPVATINARRVSRKSSTSKS